MSPCMLHLSPPINLSTEAVVVLPYATCNTYTYTISEGSSQQLCALLEYVNGSATLMNNQTILFTLVNGTAIGKFHFRVYAAKLLSVLLACYIYYFCIYYLH